MLTRLLFSIGLATLACARPAAQPDVEFTRLTLSGPAHSQPTDITGAGDGSGRLFVAEKRGTIRIIRDGVVVDPFFLDIRSQVINNGERGLLGLTFHPSFPDSPYVYVNYVINGTITNQISRFTVNPDNPDDALEESQLPLLQQTGVQTNHKAGDIVFGPDGYLYIGMGDGGGGGDPANAGQDGQTFLGKMLRIDVDSMTATTNYRIPPDNPFVGTSTLPEIWATGMRNPWRIAFDRANGDFWIADVGQNLWEEVNHVAAGTPGGMNFGWDCREGRHNYEPANCPQGTAFVEPVFEYPHNCNPCPDGQGASITGGFVYRGAAFPKLQGYYIFADYVSNYYWLLRPDPANPAQYERHVFNGTGKISGLVTFGEDDNAELYAANLQGVVYRVGTKGSAPVNWIDVALDNQPGANLIQWAIDPNPDVVSFDVERSADPDFSSISLVTQFAPSAGITAFSANDIFLQPNRWYYRIAAHLTDESVQYSPTVSSSPDPVERPHLTADPSGGPANLQLPSGWTSGTVVMYDILGREVYRQAYKDVQRAQLPRPAMPGCYVVRIENGKEAWAGQVTW